MGRTEAQVLSVSRWFFALGEACYVRSFLDQAVRAALSCVQRTLDSFTVHPVQYWRSQRSHSGTPS